MPKTTVQVTQSEVETADGAVRTTTQYRATIPKDIAEFFELDQGDELEWSAGSGRNKIEVTVTDE
ncbi:MAG: bifunctional DNA-binding transcriptional regulator [Haloarculaceae archaeon]|jgi:bifunctional DNA-binding transcriptional regulator/antitoxin component of YhaV-PrlF toxin-antitoxin module